MSAREDEQSTTMTSLRGLASVLPREGSSMGRANPAPTLCPSSGSVLFLAQEHVGFNDGAVLVTRDPRL